jgi:hypothetical protein
MPLPNRARSWGKYGAIWGAVCGLAVGGMVVLLDLPYGFLTLREKASLIFGGPVVFGAVCGIVWAVRGAIRDHLMESRDLARPREMERREDENRDWQAVQRILKRKKEDS